MALYWCNHDGLLSTLREVILPEEEGTAQKTESGRKMGAG